MLITSTPRLLIRHLEPSDLEALTPILGDNAVMEFSTTGPLSYPQIQDWLTKMLSEYQRPGFSVWAIILKDTNQLIGFSGIRAINLDGRPEIEVIFRLAQAYWNQGYATEATQAAIQYAFNTLAVNNVIAVVEPKNIRSQRVIDKLNMSYEKDSVYNGFPIRVYRLSKF